MKHSPFTCNRRYLLRWGAALAVGAPWITSCGKNETPAVQSAPADPLTVLTPYQTANAAQEIKTAL